MEHTNLVTLAVAIIAALSAFASQRSSSKAAKQAKIETARIEVENSRVDMEKNAYERARAFDTETIVRQNIRISELSREVKDLRRKVRDLESRQDHLDNSDQADYHDDGSQDYRNRGATEGDEETTIDKML